MPIEPFGYYDQIIRMKQNAGKFELRLRMVHFARQHGVKPAAKAFATTAKTVRKWLHRYQQERLAGLNELPRIPLSCPHKITPALEQKLVRLRKQFPFMGAKRLRYEHNLPCSHHAIGRVLKAYGLTRKQTAQDFSEILSQSVDSDGKSFWSGILTGYLSDGAYMNNEFTIIGRFGQGERGDIIFVPEPCTIILFSFSVLVLSRRRFPKIEITE